MLIEVVTADAISAHGDAAVRAGYPAAHQAPHGDVHRRAEGHARQRIECTLRAGHALLTSERSTAIAHAIDPNATLDNDQIDGAAAIAGTARIVAISGAAGTGKTTMLKVAGAALRRHGRNMIIVAPTKKASAVAGRETESASSSLHQLLHDYGWRWTHRQVRSNRVDAAPGRRDRPDDAEASTAARESESARRPHRRRRSRHARPRSCKRAPRRHRANRAGVAVVGDERQALPVGHSGAMALFWRALALTGRALDDPSIQGSRLGRPQPCAFATLEAKTTAAAVADELIRTGHVVMTEQRR